MSGHKKRMRAKRIECEHKACRTMRKLLVEAQAMLDAIVISGVPRLKAFDSAVRLRMKLHKAGIYLIGVILCWMTVGITDAQTPPPDVRVHDHRIFYPIAETGYFVIDLYRVNSNHWEAERFYTDCHWQPVAGTNYERIIYRDGRQIGAFTDWIQQPVRVTCAANGEQVFCATNPPGNLFFRGVRFPLSNLWQVRSTCDLAEGWTNTAGYASDASILSITATAVEK